MNIDTETLTGEERRALTRWRLALGRAVEKSGGLARRARPWRELDAALDAIWGPAVPRDLAPHLRVLRQRLDSRSFALVQREVLRRPGLAALAWAPDTLARLTPDLDLVAASLLWPSVVPADAGVEAALAQALSGAREELVRALGSLDCAGTGGGLRRIFVLLDRSPVLARSFVRGLLLAEILATCPALQVQLASFALQPLDHDLQPGGLLSLLRGVSLGDGTDVARALAAVDARVDRPESTVVVVVTDLFHDGELRPLLVRARRLVGAGAQLLVLLGFDDEGPVLVDEGLARELGRAGARCFPARPDGVASWLLPALAGRSGA